MLDALDEILAMDITGKEDEGGGGRSPMPPCPCPPPPTAPVPTCLTTMSDQFPTNVKARSLRVTLT